MGKIKDITAEIKGIKYTPFLCRKLNTFKTEELEQALSEQATFILKTGEKDQIALSWWVSAKRTRSYPYARVYDSLDFPGKKVTIIPIFKDEGKKGDRDFLQWDTISLMSLLGVYTIIAYYEQAEPSPKYKQKITKQRFSIDHLREQIKKLISYQPDGLQTSPAFNVTHLKKEIKKLASYRSDAFHWNISQIENIGEISQKALDSYQKISQKTGVEMHSKETAQKRIEQLKTGKDTFMKLSRQLAEKAQKTESITDQPKEKLSGTKSTITITNYLGGNYYFTCDETETHGNDIWLIDAKHTKTDTLPSLGDIKDGLFKMMLFTNLQNVKIDGKNFNPVPVLKLTTTAPFDPEKAGGAQKRTLELVKKEARKNNFRILLNENFIG